MLFAFIALGFHLVALLCMGRVVLHAFDRSVGTGVMVLFIPLYGVVYAFSQFEHPKKAALLFATLAASMLGSVAAALALAS